MYSVCAEFFTQQDDVNYDPSIINRIHFEKIRWKAGLWVRKPCGLYLKHE